ncbi:type I toxin-antitoxin system SymE family toxin [Dickeya fangzhongdai]|uniref:SymE family type I addiction module toxin n=1 Tax=Dickeya fangzhongdai TaxID=1778540 RepID=UPI002B2D84FE|nr:type I toxin-antitoxin system SymE family toxin [Dickeya fangzhongdai]
MALTGWFWGHGQLAVATKHFLSGGLSIFRQPLPQITLKGRWLEDLGFNTGQPVIVTVERGRLVIEAELRF